MTAGYSANEQHREVGTTEAFTAKKPRYDSCLWGKIKQHLWLCDSGDGPGVSCTVLPKQCRFAAASRTLW